jgi:hypothetical protein
VEEEGSELEDSAVEAEEADELGGCSTIEDA